MTIFLYGPSGSGKTSVGRLLAEDLVLPFYDLDREIEKNSGKSIPEIFALNGEAGFRALELAAVHQILDAGESVTALGGGALLDAGTRARIEAVGPVLCLTASLETLAQRLSVDNNPRPLLAGELQQRLGELMAQREAHYASFPLSIDTTALSLKQAAWLAQVRLGRFYVRGADVGCSVRVQSGSIHDLGDRLRELSLNGPVVVVSDENVAALYTGFVTRSLASAGFTCEMAVLPPGEQQKTIASVGNLWQAFLEARLERGSTVVALGGGVVSDLAGFAAATFLRGLPWVILPTSLLAMVDASLGGKTGADLPQGKNLVGAFHSPRLVLADPRLLTTLPPVELRCGLAEVVKHCVIGDADLFDCLENAGPDTAGSISAGPVSANAGPLNWDHIVRRSMGVKIQVIQEDPLEKGRRAILNFGHTIGHAVETASALQIRHGEAVSIGMVAETHLAERIGLAKVGLADKIAGLLTALGLPTEIPQSLDRRMLIAAVGVDKKRQSGKTRFSLPIRVGEVIYGVEIEETALCDLFSSCTGQT